MNGSNSQFAELKRILEASCERSLNRYEFDVQVKDFKSHEEEMFEQTYPSLHTAKDVVDFFKNLKLLLTSLTVKKKVHGSCEANEIDDLIGSELENFGERLSLNTNAIDATVFRSLFETELLKWMADRLANPFSQTKAKNFFQDIHDKLFMYTVYNLTTLSLLRAAITR